MTARVCVGCGTPVSYRSTARCRACAMSLLGKTKVAEAARLNEELHAIIAEALKVDPSGGNVDEVCLQVGIGPSAFARRMQTAGYQDAARVLWCREQAWSSRGGWAACQVEAARAEVRSWTA